jgi:hypothetical protein
MNRKNLKAAVLAGLITLVGIFGIGTAQALDKCMEGNWYDPTTDNGVGLDIEVLENQNLAVAHYYTWYRGYDTDTVRRDTYVFIGSNDIEGGWAFNALQSLWMGDHAGTMNVGTGSVTEIDNNTIRLEYNFKFNFLKMEDPNVAIPWCIGCWRDIEYKRLTQPHPCD